MFYKYCWNFKSEIWKNVFVFMLILLLEFIDNKDDNF
jgi:hypothetical protein